MSDTVHASVPAEQAPSDQPRRHREIVVGIDGSVQGAAALRWASDQARATGAPLRVVHAWQMPPLPSADLWNAAHADARALATRWVRDVMTDSSPAVPWSLDIVQGAPGPTLVDQSRTAGLLVLGTRQHNPLQRVVAGSVSHHCLGHAVPPVVAVPTPAPTTS